MGHVKFLKLLINMQLRDGIMDNKDFATWILDVGDGSNVEEETSRWH